MTLDLNTTGLADDIRNIYHTDPRRGHEGIERLLRDRLAGCDEKARQEALQQLTTQFLAAPVSAPGSGDERMRRIFGLILGRDVAPEDMASAEFLERLAQSLNTIFDSLNQLISVINMSFSGGAGRGDQTIRQFIGFHLDGGDHTHTLEEYLGRISTAFLTSHDAFKKAAQTLFGQIIQTLDPEQVVKERGSGLKIGPLRKAEDFNILSEKIERIRLWYESGRFMEDFLREFEKNCETINQS